MLFPNPVSEGIYLRFESAAMRLVKIEDAIGKTVAREITTGSKSSIGIGHLPAGVYFITVSDDKNNAAAKRMVKMF